MYEIIQSANWGGLNGSELEFSNPDSSTIQHIGKCLVFSFAHLDCFNKSGLERIFPDLIKSQFNLIFDLTYKINIFC